MSEHRDPSIIAADPAHSAWVAANAGSGKTYTLANRVTRLLLADAKPERILCLTYTKAGAAEMQGRLFDQLGRWSMLPDAELRANIEGIGAIADTAEELRKARRLFAQALETPGGLKIQTIHAFCQNLLSRFPLEAGVPPGFRVLDDQTAREMLDDARQRVLANSSAGDAERFAAIARLATETSEFQMRRSSTPRSAPTGASSSVSSSRWRRRRAPWGVPCAGPTRWPTAKPPILSRPPSP